MSELEEPDREEMAGPRRSPRTQRWWGKAQFIDEVIAAQADSELRTELAELGPDTTDDLPER